MLQELAKVVDRFTEKSGDRKVVCFGNLLCGVEIGLDVDTGEE